MESAVAGLFVVLAATAVTGAAWLLVLGCTGHGLKDACSSAATTSPTPDGGPFCAAVDWLLPPSSSSPSLPGWVFTCSHGCLGVSR